MKIGKYPIVETMYAITLIVLNVFSYFYIKKGYALILFVTIVLIVLLIANFFSEKKRRDIAVGEVSYYVDKHGSDLFTKFPVGVISVNASGIIRWVNKFMELQFEDSIEMRSIAEIFPGIYEKLNDENYEEDVVVSINERFFKVELHDGGMYFFDVTSGKIATEKYLSNRPVVGVINFDNYDDYTGSLDDQRSSDITLYMSQMINRWCAKHGIYIRKYNSNRFLLFTCEETLKNITKEGFVILDQVREYGTKCKLPLTLSISFAHDVDDVTTLAEIAYEGLDLVLSRGGDQVVVKNKTDSSEFYGGKTDAFKKRNRAKARMFASSVANLARKSSNVVIMGHRNPDFDSIGGSVGMSKIAELYNENVIIALDTQNVSSSTKKLLHELEGTNFAKCIVSPNEAIEHVQKETLLIVVDTHKSSLVASNELLDKARNIIVIDHHRRGDDFIANPIVSYVEPYASSTSELVTELFGFQTDRINICALESTAMLAGIIMDTKHFVYRTGNRTFDAAAKLKTLGADTILIQDLLKEELEQVVIRNEMISRLELINNSIAVTSVYEDTIVGIELLAQTADEIMTIEGIKSAYVVGYTGESVYMSARSLGEDNVQIVAEKFGGGGHMTAAATQSVDDSVEQFVEKLISYLKGEDENESDFSN